MPGAAVLVRTRLLYCAATFQKTSERRGEGKGARQMSHACPTTTPLYVHGATGSTISPEPEKGILVETVATDTRVLEDIHD